jgi:hypothetical protein
MRVGWTHSLRARVLVARRLFTLDPWLPCADLSSEEEPETHIPSILRASHQPLPHPALPQYTLTSTHDAHRYSTANIDPAPLLLNSLLTSKAPPALDHFVVQERHTATLACLDTESYSSPHTYIFAQWPPPPLHQQHKAPSPPLPPTAM